jgi:hypothetical protein
MQKAGVLVLATQAEADRKESNAADFHANTSRMNLDRNYGAVLVGLRSTGYLTSASKIGVLMEGCPSNKAAYSNTVAPLIKQFGWKPAKVVTIDCVAGFGGVGNAGQQISNAAFTFRSAGVDRVLMMSVNEVVMLLVFAPAAENQQYFPGYALSSNAQAQRTRPSIPRGQWPQLHGIGAVPIGDVDPPPGALALLPVEKRCLKVAADGGQSPSTYGDRGIINNSCSAFLLLEKSLQVSAGEAASRTLVAAIASLGTSFVAPGLVDGATRFTQIDHDGPNRVRPFSFQKECTCLRYVGPSTPAPK